MKKASILVLVVAFLGPLVLSGCEGCSRGLKSFKSNTVGLERKVVWTGYDGSKRTWTGKFKIDSNNNSPTVYFITDDGRTVILGPGYYSEEVK